MSENPYDPETSDEQRDFTGPDGVEGADRLFELERERDAESRSEDAADFPTDLGEEELTAAEQGNREGDEMVSEGDDPEEVAELAGDDLDIDALEEEPDGPWEEQ